MVTGMSTLSLNETFNVPRGTQRFRELILYIAKACASDQWFGAIKLNKVLYHADFRAFERFGIPLTGVRYFRLKNGPAPKMLLPVQRELVREGALKIEEREVGGRTQKRSIALRNPVLELFSADELALVDEVIRDLWRQNATEVSDASHDIRWRALQDKDPLPYELVHLEDAALTEAELIRTRELATELGW